MYCYLIKLIIQLEFSPVCDVDLLGLLHIFLFVLPQIVKINNIRLKRILMAEDKQRKLPCFSFHPSLTNTSLLLKELVNLLPGEGNEASTAYYGADALDKGGDGLRRCTTLHVQSHSDCKNDLFLIRIAQVFLEAA